MDFSGLRCLLLGNNKIDSWDSVEALASFPSLTELRLSGNPLFPNGAMEKRFEVHI
jgi:Leucine-rich repeat (LRR) protein